MASEHYKCKAEPSVIDIEEDGMEQIPTYFVDIQDILKREIKKEATELKPFSEYGVSNECLENDNGKFDGTNSSEFEVMPRDSIEDSKESKFSPAELWENRNFNGLADELAKQKVNHLNNEVILKNEDNDESLTNNVELKMKTLKNEGDIDIIYEDVKHEICEAEANGKSENGSNLNSVAGILIGTEIRPNFSHKFSKDSETWPQQIIEEDGTALERDNDTRKGSTLTIDSKNCRKIQNLPHCRYPEFHPFESKQNFDVLPNTEKKPFHCLPCSKTFTKEETFLRHERIHRGEKQFQCKFCSESFTLKKFLLFHERNHTDQKIFLCKICLKSFTHRWILERHERVHTGKKTFQCKICSKSFNQKGHLIGHEACHAGEKPFQCRICSKNFTVKHTLLVHERLHTVEKPFQCKICLESFNKKFLLMIHEKIHTGKKPFQCKICLKSFNKKLLLMIHEKIHTGKKPFQCKICPKNYLIESALLYHERNHTGEKLLQCKICLKSFNYKSNLTRHERIHTRETFQCQICPKLFNDNENLMYHERMHAVENLFNASFV